MSSIKIVDISEAEIYEEPTLGSRRLIRKEHGAEGHFLHLSEAVGVFRRIIRGLHPLFIGGEVGSNLLITQGGRDGAGQSRRGVTGGR